MNISTTGLEMSTPQVIVIEEQILVRRGIEAHIAEVLPSAEVTSFDNFPTFLPESDLIVCDFMVGKTKVTSFLKALRLRGCSTPVLVFCLCGNGNSAEESERAGASAFLTKNASLEDFSGAMRALLSGDAWNRKSHSRALGSDGQQFSDPSLRLSKRELDVFAILGQEVPVRIIAKRLGISVKTVESHRESIKNKLGLHNAAEVVRAASHWLFARTARPSFVGIGDSA